MNKKPYRNALRSRQMIQDAFLELLAEKPLERITVVDIVRRSDLSRNTFYAHYQDVYAVVEEYQQKLIVLMEEFLSEVDANQDLLTNPQPLLQKVADHVNTNITIYQAFLKSGQAEAFTSAIKRMLIQYVSNNVGFRDKEGLLVLIDVMAVGFFHLFQQYLCGESSLNPDQIVEEISKIYRSSVSLYQ